MCVCVGGGGGGGGGGDGGMGGGGGGGGDVLDTAIFKRVGGGGGNFCDSECLHAHQPLLKQCVL